MYLDSAPEAIVADKGKARKTAAQSQDMAAYVKKCRQLEEELVMVREEKQRAEAEKDVLKSKLDDADRRRLEAEKEVVELEKKILSEKLLKETKYPRVYEVEEGDSLWIIASKKQIYDNPYKWLEIFYANRDKIEDPDIIYPGIVLRIPRYEELIQEADYRNDNEEQTQ